MSSPFTLIRRAQKLDASDVALALDVDLKPGDRGHEMLNAFSHPVIGFTHASRDPLPPPSADGELKLANVLLWCAPLSRGVISLESFAAGGFSP